MISNKLLNLANHFRQMHRENIPLTPEGCRMMGERMAALSLQTLALENAQVRTDLTGQAEVNDKVVVMFPTSKTPTETGGDAA